MWKFRPDIIYRSTIFSKPKFVARFFKITAFNILIWPVTYIFYTPPSFAAIWPGVKPYLGLLALMQLTSYMVFLSPLNRYAYKITFDGRSVNYSFGRNQGVIPLKTISRVEVEEVRGWNRRFWVPFAPDVVTEDGVLCYIASSGPAVKIIAADGTYLVSCRNPTALKAAIDECRREREAEPEVEDKTARTKQAVERKPRSPISRPRRI